MDRTNVTAAQLRRVYAERPNQDSRTMSQKLAAQLLGATYLAVATRVGKEIEAGRAARGGDVRDAYFLLKGI